jgi:hypothetical protein
MRFLVVKDVPGVKELQSKIYSLIFNFPHLFKENPHSGMQHYNNRYDLYGSMEQLGDETYKFTDNEKDSEEMKEYKSVAAEFSQIKLQVVL